MTPLRQNERDIVIQHIGFYPKSNHEIATSHRAYLFCKRTIDIVASVMAMFFLTPLFVIVAILIKLEDSHGAVLFHQTRIGKNEKPFRMYKIRSMVSNAEELLKELLEKNEIEGLMFKIKDDPRITKVGKFIRRTSIDELPQLFNVLRGEMTLVGPRPPLPREVLEYSSYDRLRLTVTPGCTGLWQVSGRNILTFNEMVELDLAYIQQRSGLLDTKIVFKTIRTMINPKNAF